MDGLVDSHCHLQDPAFDTDRDEVLARAAAAGIERLLVPGYDVPSSRKAVELARRHSAITAAVGIHPHFAAEAATADWDELADLAGASDVGAIGEIGLDYFRNLSPPKAQREAFARQLALATTAGKPVLVHDRDAHDDVRQALLAWPGPGAGRAVRGVLHAYSGDATLAQEMTAAGFLVSFALPLTFRSATGPRAAAAALPTGTFLVETDSPWLAPQGSGVRNEPTTVLRVVTELARLRHQAPETVASEIGRTFDRLLGV
jgi:TatD DNase family protein